MIEALYGVTFKFNNTQDSGAGVAVLETNRVLGGDSGFTYIGDYKVENNTFYANVEVTNENGHLPSASGINHYNLVLSGPHDQSCKKFVLTGHVQGQPQITATVTLTRRAELP